MSSQPKRKRALELLDEFSEASRRPLFVEVELVRQEHQNHNPKRTSQASWNKIIDEASALIYFFAEEEYGKLLKICARFLLGYVLPHSTASDFYVLQNSEKRPNDESGIENVLLQIPLVSRLDVGIRSFSATHQTAGTDPMHVVDPYFDRFLDCLGGLLSRRRINSDGADLLHVAALAIHPAPVLDSLDKHPASDMTRRLLNHLTAHQFSVPNRRRLIQLVEESIYLPSMENTAEVGLASLEKGAIPHLLASLRARSGCERACIQLVSQTRKFRGFIQPEWERLFEPLVRERQRSCQACSKGGTECHYSSQGDLISCLIRRCCMLKEFQEHVAPVMADAIEWQLEAWKKTTTVHYPACLLATLLDASSHFCWGSQGVADVNVVDSMIRSSIQLLAHPVCTVVNQASKILQQFLVLMNESEASKYSKAVATALKVCSHKHLAKRLVGTMASLSVSFSDDLLRYALGDIESNGPTSFLCSWVTAIALNSPTLSELKQDRLQALLTDKRLKENHKLGIATALLSIRQSHYFIEDFDSSILSNVNTLLQDSWSLYKLAVSAMVTSNHTVVVNSILRLQRLDMSETLFLWTTILLKISMAGDSLASKGALGIPDASKDVASGLEYLEHLAIVDADWNARGGFQKRYLLLFLDFLELLTVLRYIAREVRMSADIPRRTTRTIVHLRNVARAFEELGKRFWRLRTRFGAVFRFNESSGMLRLFGEVCQFMDHSTRRIFPEVFKSRAGVKNTRRGTPFACNGNHPLASMMRKLDTLLLEPMSASLDPLVRAAALIELIDAVLKAPLPFPRDFLVPIPEVYASLIVSPEELQGAIDEDADIFASPGICLSFVVSGQLPDSLMKRLRNQIVSIHVWFRLNYRQSVFNDNEDEAQEDTETTESLEIQPPDLKAFSPLKTTLLLPSSTFSCIFTGPPVNDEGMYDLEVRLGFVDALGNEWEVPLFENDKVHRLKVSRTVSGFF